MRMGYRPLKRRRRFFPAASTTRCKVGTSRVCFRSGATDREGAIEFQGWGQVTVDAPKEFQPCLRIGPDKVTLELEAQGRPAGGSGGLAR